jgi:sugar lactone lactonase YvrE
MTRRFFSLLSVLVLGTNVSKADLNYEFAPNFIKPPAGLDTIGNGHGEIQVDSAGNIYVSVEGQEKGGLQVYSADGTYLKHLELPATLHGFSIRKSADGEFIYAAVLGQQKVIKATLEGKIVLEIPRSSFPAEIADPITLTLKDGKTIRGSAAKEENGMLVFTSTDGQSQRIAKADIATKGSIVLANGSKVEGLNPVKDDSGVTLTVGGQSKKIAFSEMAQKDGKPAFTQSVADSRGGLKLTSADVAPNGDIYVVDGYGTSWIFVFDSAGKFKKQFGGPGEPFKLANCHKIHIDTRFQPARVFLCDRGNKRIMHSTLDGELLGVIATGLRNPSSASFNGDYVCIAEIAGRVSVWDKEGKMVAALGTNDTPGQTNTPRVPPADWRDNTVTSPHGITFDAKGNILETEWNQFGRVLRWNKK